MWIDNDFPNLIGAELYRPHPSYIAEMAFQPVIVHDFGKMPGQTVQLDKYDFWGNPGTKESRERSATQTIGTTNSRDITKKTTLVTLREYTGPADPATPDDPSTFKIAKYTALTAQRVLWQYGVQAFHQSIGSITLLDDYRRWRDRVWINEALKTSNTYNPLAVADGGSYTGTRDSARFDVTRDLLGIVEMMRSKNVPTFEDGNYRCLCSPRFMKHLRANSDFREVARYPGNGTVNPQMAYLQPNALLFQGPQYGQATMMGEQPTLPTGFVFEGVRWFESTNLPTETVSMGFSGGAASPTAAHLGVFFGPQALGLGIGGNNAQVLLNNNDDFSRFVIAIWQLYGGFELLQPDFITVARTYAD